MPPKGEKGDRHDKMLARKKMEQEAAQLAAAAAAAQESVRKAAENKAEIARRLIDTHLSSGVPGGKGSSKLGAGGASSRRLDPQLDETSFRDTSSLVDAPSMERRVRAQAARRVIATMGTPQGGHREPPTAMPIGQGTGQPDWQPQQPYHPDTVYAPLGVPLNGQRGHQPYYPDHGASAPSQSGHFKQGYQQGYQQGFPNPPGGGGYPPQGHQGYSGPVQGGYMAGPGPGQPSFPAGTSPPFPNGHLQGPPHGPMQGSLQGPPVQGYSGQAQGPYAPAPSPAPAAKGGHQMGYGAPQGTVTTYYAPLAPEDGPGPGTGTTPMGALPRAGSRGSSNSDGYMPLQGQGPTGGSFVQEYDVGSAPRQGGMQYNGQLAAEAPGGYMDDRGSVYSTPGSARMGPMPGGGGLRTSRSDQWPAPRRIPSEENLHMGPSSAGAALDGRRQSFPAPAVHEVDLYNNEQEGGADEVPLVGRSATYGGSSRHGPRRPSTGALSAAPPPAGVILATPVQDGVDDVAELEYEEPLLSRTLTEPGKARPGRRGSAAAAAGASANGPVGPPAAPRAAFPRSNSMVSHGGPQSGQPGASQAGAPRSKPPDLLPQRQVQGAPGQGMGPPVAGPSQQRTAPSGGDMVGPMGAQEKANGGRTWSAAEEETHVQAQAVGGRGEAVPRSGSQKNKSPGQAQQGTVSDRDDSSVRSGSSSRAPKQPPAARPVQSQGQGQGQGQGQAPASQAAFPKVRSFQQAEGVPGAKAPLKGTKGAKVAPAKDKEWKKDKEASGVPLPGHKSQGLGLGLVRTKSEASAKVAAGAGAGGGASKKVSFEEPELTPEDFKRSKSAGVRSKAKAAEGTQTAKAGGVRRHYS